MSVLKPKKSGWFALGALIVGGMLSYTTLMLRSHVTGEIRAYQRGQSLEAVQMPIEAQAAYEESIRLNPAYAPPYRALAECAVVRGDNEAAITYWKAFVLCAPQAPHAWCRLAQAEALAGLEKPAVGDAEQELRRAPNCPRAHLALGVLYAKQNNAQEALLHLVVAAKAYPADSQVQMVYGKVLALTRQFEAAESVMKSIIARDSSHAQPFYWLGYIAARRDNGLADKMQAESALRHALVLEPDDADANFELGRFYFNHKQDTKALPYLHQAVMRKRHFVAALYTLSQVQSALGQSAEARRTQATFQHESDLIAHEKSLLAKYVVAPDDLPNLFALGLLELERQEPVAAQMFLQSAARRSPQDAHVQDALRRADQMRAASVNDRKP